MFNNLESNRLTLKCIDETDREFVYRQFSDSAVTKYLYDEEPLTDISGADEIINFYLEAEPRCQHRWIVIEKSIGIKIGTCGYHCWDREKERVEIGYDLLEAYWGNGYMTEALNTIIVFAKNQMNIKEIVASISVDNQQSIKLIEKLGFKVVGSTNLEFRGHDYLHSTYLLNL